MIGDVLLFQFFERIVTIVLKKREAINFIFSKPEMVPYLQVS